MLIVCPNCATSYQVEASSLGQAGRSVRCARCRNTWFAANPAAMAAVARTHRQDVAAFAATTSIGDFAAAHEPTPPALPVLAEAPSIDPAVAEEAAASAGLSSQDVSFQDVSSQDLASQDLSSQSPYQDQPPYEEQFPAEHLPPDGGSAPNQDIIDVERAPELAHVRHGEAAPTIEASPAPPEDIESFAARRLRRQAARRRSRWSVPGLTTVILALLAANAGLLGWRANIVQWFPQTASLYSAIGLPVNLRGLVFTDIVTRKDMQDGVHVLIVEGFIRNDTRTVAQIPRLRFAVRNNSRHEIYSWTAQPARNAIPAGSTLPFRSRLASPPPETREVLVRFFNRRDLVAGIQ